jgi:tRNA 2-thiouridine synthesizing protein A
MSSGPDRKDPVNSAAPARIIDARGLKCPLPVLRTRKALLAMDAGEQLHVHCTDPVSVIDIPHLVAELGCALLQTDQVDDCYRFVISAKRDDR